MTLQEHLQRLIRERPGPKEPLEAFAELAEILEGAPTGPSEAVLAPDRAEVKLRQGFPVFAREELPLPLDRAGEVLDRILAHRAGSARSDADGIRQALDRARKDRSWVDRVFQGFLSKDPGALSGPARELGLEPGVLRFLARAALRPFVAQVSEAAEALLQGDPWPHAYCPVCGSPPDMACLDEEGKRRLHCSLCSAEWRYARIGCPFCGNEDQERLGYLAVEGEEGFRVDLCDACRRYLKTVDRRVLEFSAPLDLEHLATLHLDLVAVDRGYR